MPSALRAVLFDLGDTLVRLDASGGSLVTRAAARLNTAVDGHAAGVVWQRVLAAASRPEELAKGRDLSPERHRAVWTELYRRCGADDLAPGLAESIYTTTIDPASWVAFPDAVDTLRALHRAGIPAGALSDTGFDLRPVLERTGLAPYLTTVVLSCEYGACKPDPAVFTAACAGLGVDPAETLMVGDNPWSDGGAVAAGLPTLLLPPPASPASPASPEAPGERGLRPVLQLLGVSLVRPR